MAYIKTYIFIMAIFSAGYGLAYYCASQELRRYIDGRFYASFALTTLAGFFAPEIFSYFTCVIIIFLATTRDRLDATCRYILMIGLMPAVAKPLGFGASYLTVLEAKDILGFAFLIAILAKGRARGTPIKGFTPEDALIIVLYLILWIGAGRSYQSTILIRGATTQAMLLLLPYFLLRSSINDAKQLRMVVACFAVTAVIMGLFAFYETRASWAIFDAIPKRLGDSVSMPRNTMRRGSLLRASVTMMGPLSLATFMVLGFTAVACSRGLFRRNAGYWICLAAAFMGVVATQSRGNAVAVGLTIIALMYAWRRYGAAVGATVGVGLAALAITTLANYSQTLAAFLNKDTSAATGVYDYRQVLLQRGMEEGMRHPIIGENLGVALDNLQDIVQGEGIVDLVNVYLSLFISSGLVGMIPFLLLLLSSANRIVAGYARIRDPDILMARAFALAGMVAIVLELSFMSFIDRVPFLFAFVLVSIRLVRGERDRALRRTVPSLVPEGVVLRAPALPGVSAVPA